MSLVRIVITVVSPYQDALGPCVCFKGLLKECSRSFWNTFNSFRKAIQVLHKLSNASWRALKTLNRFLEAWLKSFFDASKGFQKPLGGL